MVATAAAALIAVALGAAYFRAPAPTAAESLRASVPLPAGFELDGSGPPELALSHDGRTLAFLARVGNSPQQLFVRALDQDQATAVPGSETAEGPFFSPDSRWVAFAVGVSTRGIHPPEIRKYSLDTKITQTIASVDDYFGGYWTDEDSIVFIGAQPRGLYRVAAGGGTPTPFVAQVRVNGRDLSRAMAWPDAIPGGAVLVTDWSNSSLGSIAVLDTATRELTSLGLDGAGARFVPGGYIVYGTRNASLMAVPFDPASRRITGTPVALMTDIGFGRNNVPVFAFSGAGTFAYASGYLRWSRREPMRLIRVAPSGATTTLPFDPQLFNRGFALSPGGDAIVAGLWDNSRWLFDLDRRTRVKLPAGGPLETQEIAWSQDGRRFVLSGTTADEAGRWAAFAQNADGSGEVVRLGKPVDGEIHVAGWMPDNVHVIVFTFTSSRTGASFMRIGPDGGEDELFVDDGTIGSARPSPDGRWLAYASTSSGDFDVYLTPLTGAHKRVTVSQGASNPVWARDGRELYFVRDRTVFAVAIEYVKDSVRIGPERKLFEWNVDSNRDYAVGRDGELYSVDRVPDAPVQTLIHLRTNWFDEVQRLAGKR